MKTLLSSPMVAAMVALITVVLGGCTQDDGPDDQGEKNIVQVVVSNNDFSLLAKAVDHAGLVQTLSASGPFTLFAPTNGAFEAAGLGSDGAIRNLPAQTVRNILMYHVLGDRVPTASIPEAAHAPIATAAGTEAYVSRNPGGTYINGATVVEADVMAGNGIIHGIDKVLFPPTGNAVEALMENGNFSMLVAAIVRASEGTTNLVEVLMGEGPFTIFVPTDQAFMDAGFSNAMDIQAADPDVLAGILTYHVLAARAFSSDLEDGATVTTVNGADLGISLANGAQVKGNGNEDPSAIVQMDWVAENGVLHVIDRVLLP